MFHFIINPTSGNGKSIKAREAVESVLNAMNVEYRFHETDRKHHAVRIVRELTRSGERDIVVMGGDGTLHEVLNGLHDPQNVNLGLIPCGSGNDFAVSAKIPEDPVAALDIVLKGETKFTDYMVCSGVRGINVMGTGVDVEILKRCYRSKILKGKMKYLISTLITVFSYKYPHTTVTRGGKTTEHDCFIVSTANGKCFGGSIVIAPNAEIDDGKLDFVLVNGMKGYQKPNALAHLATGKILDIKQTEFENVEALQAVFTEPVDVQIDGEIYHDLKYDVSIVHNQLRMFRP